MPQNVVACESSRESYFRTCFGWRTGTSSPYRYTVIEAWLSSVFWGMRVEINEKTRHIQTMQKGKANLLRQFASIFSKITACKESYLDFGLHQVIQVTTHPFMHPLCMHITWHFMTLYQLNALCRPHNTVTNSDNRPSDSEVDCSSGWRFQGKFVVEYQSWDSNRSWFYSAYLLRPHYLFWCGPCDMHPLSAGTFIGLLHAGRYQFTRSWSVCRGSYTHGEHFRNICILTQIT